MDEKFIRDRITALRMKKGVSEYQMSLDLGHSQSYIQNITSGKVMPSIRGLFDICGYLDIPVSSFFDSGIENPILMNQVFEGMKGLKGDDLQLLILMIRRLASAE